MFYADDQMNSAISKIYPSKISWGIFLPLTFFLLLSSIFMIRSGDWIGTGVILAVLAFIVHLLTNTYYTIQGSQLMIKSGFLYYKCLDIAAITKISETNNPISSPAASLDRLEITWEPYGGVIISPKDKQDFLEQLLQINPRIQIHYKQHKA